MLFASRGEVMLPRSEAFSSVLTGITRLPRTTRSRYRLLVAAEGWTRRLDDRAQLLLNRRFGSGLTRWDDLSLR